MSFFAPWCTECIVEHAELRELAEGAPRDLEVVSVVVDTPAEDVRRFLAQHPASWPFVLDPSGRNVVAYGQVRVPETYLVGPDSTVVARFDGAITSEDIEAVIAKVSGPSPLE